MPVIDPQHQLQTWIVTFVSRSETLCIFCLLKFFFDEQIFQILVTVANFSILWKGSEQRRFGRPHLHKTCSYFVNSTLRGSTMSDLQKKVNSFVGLICVRFCRPPFNFFWIGKGRKAWFLGYNLGGVTHDRVFHSLTVVSSILVRLICSLGLSVINQQPSWTLFIRCSAELILRGSTSRNVAACTTTCCSTLVARHWISTQPLHSHFECVQYI